MSKIEATTGFNFYENLRYLLPGLFLVFLLGYIVFPAYGSQFDISEKIILGILIGFVMHSFGLYKWVPGASKIRREYHNKAEDLLGYGDVYLRWDTVILTMNLNERQYFRKYFALGAFKLDIVFILINFLLYYVYYIIVKFIYNHILKYYQLFIVIIIIVIIFFLRDDGINDLKRAFNIMLMCILENYEKEEFKKKIELIKKNSDYFIFRKRKFLHPPF